MVNPETMSTPTRQVIESLFRRWRRAVDSRDFEAMRDMLTPDARGGNAVFGLFAGRDAVVEFSESNWPESVPNVSIWHAIDGVRLVNKWKETMPGNPSSGEPFDYFGISEFIYDESGRWNYMYGLPDVSGLMRVHARWQSDGHAAEFPEVYSEMG